jgi:hypothetical protein
MSEELNYNFAFESSKEKFIVHGLEHCLMPGLHELFHLCKKDFARMILDAENEVNKYQFILTIKELD